MAANWRGVACNAGFLRFSGGTSPQFVLSLKPANLKELTNTSDGKRPALRSFPAPPADHVPHDPEAGIASSSLANLRPTTLVGSSTTHPLASCAAACAEYHRGRPFASVCGKALLPSPSLIHEDMQCAFFWLRSPWHSIPLCCGDLNPRSVAAATPVSYEPSISRRRGNNHPLNIAEFAASVRGVFGMRTSKPGTRCALYFSLACQENSLIRGRMPISWRHS